jgi:hypothetical protein
VPPPPYSPQVEDISYEDEDSSTPLYYAPEEEGKVEEKHEGICDVCKDGNAVTDQCSKCTRFIHDWCKEKWCVVFLFSSPTSPCLKKRTARRDPPESLAQKAKKATMDSSPGGQATTRKKDKDGKKKKQEEKELVNSWIDAMGEIFIQRQCDFTFAHIQMLFLDISSGLQINTLFKEHPEWVKSVEIICAITMTGLVTGDDFINFSFAGMLALPNTQMCFLFFTTNAATMGTEKKLGQLILDMKGIFIILLINISGIRKYKLRSLERNLINKALLTKENKHIQLNGMSIHWWETMYQKIGMVQYF